MMVLGRAQDGGLPQLGCRRSCCTQARSDGRRELPSALGVVDHQGGSLHLLEATPAIEEQVALLQSALPDRPLSAPLVDGVLVTHAHMGHYLGLAQLGREVAATDRMPLHVSARVANFLHSNQPWAQLIQLDQVELRVFEPGVRFELVPDLFIRPIPVPHRDEFFDTMAFVLEGPRGSVLFLPDIDRWDASGLDREFLPRLVDDVDVAYLDGTFYDGRELSGRDLGVIPHPPMTDTMQRLESIARERPGVVRFIHLNHTNPVLHEPALRDDLRRRGFDLAAQGERVAV